MVIFFVGVTTIFSIQSLVEGIGRSSDSANWVQVPDHIESVAMKTTIRKTGPAPWLCCQYSYEFQGRSYKGKELALTPERTRNNDWLATWESILTTAHRRGEPVPCFVNPKNPGEAVLDRTVTFGDLSFAVVFLLASIGYFTAFALTRRRKPRRR